MVVSIQDSSPVNWSSWERRLIPGGAGAEAELGASCLALACGWRGGAFSRTSWAKSVCGKGAARRENARTKSRLFITGRIIEAGHPAQSQGASPLLADAWVRRKRCPGLPVKF